MFATQRSLMRSVGIQIEGKRLKFATITLILLQIGVLLSHVCVALKELYYHFNFDVATNNMLHIIGFAIGAK